MVANDGHCSLREAISSANGDAASGATPGECAAGSGADAIALPAGFFVLAIAGAGEDANVTGDLDVLSDLTLTGVGADITTISGEGVDRVLDVASGHTVALSNLTIAGGETGPGTNGALVIGSTGGNGNPPGGGGVGIGTNGGAAGNGGGIRNAGTLTVTGCAISNNRTGNGGFGGPGIGGLGGNGTVNSAGGAGGTGIGGIGGTGGSGGGIFNSGALTIRSSTISGNETGDGGAAGPGIGNPGGTGAGSGAGGAGGTAIAGIAGSGGAGGAIAGNGTLDVAGSTLSENTTGEGGNGSVAIGGTAGTGGATSGAGGVGGTAIGGVGGTGGPGGALSLTGTATLTQTTMARNTTGDGGGAGPVFGGTGGTGGAPNGPGGAGGTAIGGVAVTGGGGGAVSDTVAVTVVNTTIHANRTGAGGFADITVGGAGGSGTGVGNGGTGGVSVGGIGGSGGSDSGFTGSGALTLTHATVSSNEVGGGGSVGGATAGPGGAHGGGGGSNGATGQVFPGLGGNPGLGGGIGSTTKTLTNSIVADNAPRNCSGAAATDGGHNIRFGDATCPGTTADPKLGLLANNGGPTQTRALRHGSGAIDTAGTGGACTATDQRGVARPQGAACDSGAYEVAAPSVATTAATDVSSTGAKLNGSVNPNGRATSYHFEFGTTAGYGSRTADQPAGADIAAAAASAAITGLAPSATYHYRMVATSADGTSAGGDVTFTTTANAPPRDTVAPVLSAVSLTNKTFAVTAKPTALSAKAKKGTTVRYTLSEAATVAITIQKASNGRKIGKRCVKPTAKNRKAKPCTRYTTLGKLTRASVAGANRVPFSGRLGTKKLKPGKYRASLVAKDAAGNSSKAVRLAFKVVAR